MKKIKKIAWAVRQWRWVGPSGRFITRVECFYRRRVHRPVSQWRQFGGRPPVLPRWQPFVFSFLSVVGGRFPVRLRRGQQRPVPPVRRGARVYSLSPARVFVPSPAQEQHLRWQRFLLQQELRQSQQRRFRQQ